LRALFLFVLQETIWFFCTWLYQSPLPTLS